jgi:hypothetical protein
LFLQELQSFYATYISPASTQRRKLCIYITPTNSQQQQQQGGDSSKAKPPQEHVQHEFGVIHPAGEHTQHSTPQHTRQGTEAVNGDLPAATTGSTAAAAAAVDGSKDSPSTRQSKRPRRQQQQQQQQNAGEPASLEDIQAAPVQVVEDVKGFKVAAGRYEAYMTVVPQLKC